MTSQRLRAFFVACVLALFPPTGLIAAPAHATSLIGANIGNRHLISIDKTSGEVTVIATTASMLRGLTFDFASGTLFGLGYPGSQIFEIDPLTGTLNAVGALTGISNPVAIAFDPVGEVFYVADTTTDSLFIFDPINGHTLAGPQIVGFSNVEGLSFDPTSGVLYGLADGQNTVITIDIVSGVAIPLPVSLPPTNWRALAFDPELDALFLATSAVPGGDLWSIDLASNQLTRVGPIGTVQALAAVSEPGTAIDIDIRPWTDTNPINPLGRGVIPVALLGSDDFDVADVDVTTLAFGPNGAAPAFPFFLSDWDLNNDDEKDLVAYYRTDETGIAMGDTEACLTGETQDGTPFEGCDVITTVPCGHGFEAALVVPPVVWIGGRMRRRRR